MTKAVPNHKSSSFQSNHYSPTKHEVEELKSKNAFKDGYDLKEQLEEIYRFENSMRQAESNTVAPSDQKNMLKRLRNCSSELNEILTNLGTDERIRLNNSMRSEKSISLSALEQEIERLHLASIVAIKGISRGERGKQANVWEFIRRLAQVWKEGTGKQPTTNYSDYAPEDSKYIGDFYFFVIDCAELGNIILSENGDPGGTVRNALKEWTQVK